MAGKKGCSGGARPGAGRKSEATEQYQIHKRAIVEEVVTDEDWRMVVLVALSRAKAGDDNSRNWLTPFVVGKDAEKLKVEQDGKVVVEVVYIDGQAKS
jgi:hypothetical protein